MTDLEKQQLYTFRMGWWNKLDDSWKSIYYYYYLLKRTPDLIRETVWNNKEISGTGEEGSLIGIVNFDLLKNNFPFPAYFVILGVLKSVELFDISQERFWTYEFEGRRYRIYWDFNPKSSNGLRELKQIENLHLYKQDNDKSKQPKLDVTDFTDWVNLQELHLHISHCYQLEEILLLNLPNLRKISFYTGLNEHSYDYVTKEESIIDSMKQRTKIELQLNCYTDF